jgi:hypothetical protein
MPPNAPHLAVFSHPNHELAVFGFVQRFRPTLLFLTDGGGAQRVAETRAGLESIGLADQAQFLNHPEAALYEALIRCDVGFCQRLVAEIATVIDAVQPQSIFCDAVEFYNPVHDLSLPLVLAAVAQSKQRAAVFEVPLIFQRPGVEEEEYEIQRLPASQQDDQIELHLNEVEVAAKLRARAEVYAQLNAQMSGLLDLPVSHFALEVLRPSSTVSQPDGERMLRYEWRGRRLQTHGQVDQVITYSEHYQPLIAALCPS